MYKTHHSWITSVVARSIFRSQKWEKLKALEHFWTFGCRFAWQVQGILHLAKSERNVKVLWHFRLQSPLHYTTLHSITLHYTRTTTTTTTTTTLHYTTLIALHYPTLHSTTLHYITLHELTLHYTNYTCNYNYSYNYTTCHYATPH